MTSIKFGKYIKKLRTDSDLSLAVVSERSGISTSQLSRIETGKRGIPKAPTILGIAKALNVDYNHLLEIAGYTKSLDTLGSCIELSDYLNELIYEIEENGSINFNGVPLNKTSKLLLKGNIEHLLNQMNILNNNSK